MKKVILPLVLLIVGLAGGYYWGKSGCPTPPLTNSDYSVTDIDSLSADKAAELAKVYDKNAFSLSDRDDESRPIEKRLAFQLIKAFQHQNEGTLMPFPVRTTKGRARGYFIDKGPLKKILANDAWDGVSVFFAKDQSAPGGSKRIYTLIYMGGRYTPDRKNVINHLEPGQVRAESDGSDTLAYDFVKPCPTVCSDFDSHEPGPTVVNSHPKAKGKK
ncbi:hypothetical protein HQ865_21525 [Mucilaginibacter mali]|uniref:Uncharacterized protein n=1 Tax=Mucilaginibacter mali TaxID=2740462 RepID=A0A7D4QAY3_9SPHI|nr:hypothetical protein [Mucilaginibacter mali]QKJ32231.1 hypothetical protein HQ865_21525 [Mucilaginibacter mali]